MSEAKKSYAVLDSLRHNGKKYFPDSENNVVELTSKEAAPLLALGVIGKESGGKTDSGSGGDGNNNPAPEGAEKIAKIKEAIDSLDKENKELFTNAGLPKMEAIEAVTGWPVSAKERGAALEADSE